jgi:Zn-dependent protease with chaperone function
MGRTSDLRVRSLRATSCRNFFFVPALTGAQDQQRGQGGGFSFGSLFRTHPTLERRLAQLDQLEHQLGQAR